MGQISIVQRRSLIGQPQKMRRVVRSLGLKKIGHRVLKKDNNCVRGMINKATHLVSYELLTDGEKQ